MLTTYLSLVKPGKNVTIKPTKTSESADNRQISFEYVAGRTIVIKGLINSISLIPI